MTSYRLDAKITQQRDQTSYIGGIPQLPEGQGIPTCSYCGQEQTFFFQIEIPEPEIRQGMIFSLFACTSCVNPNHLIPEMLIVNDQWPPKLVPRRFLRDYQTNFRFLCFPASSMAKVTTYKERVAFRELVFVPETSRRLRLDDLVSEFDESNFRNSPVSTFGKFEGCPIWEMEDETPGPLDGQIPFDFGFQVTRHFFFDLVPDAPRQMTLDLGGRAVLADEPYAYLFNGNMLYFFFSREDPFSTYIVTQAD